MSLSAATVSTPNARRGTVVFFSVGFLLLLLFHVTPELAYLPAGVGLVLIAHNRKLGTALVAATALADVPLPPGRQLLLAGGLWLFWHLYRTLGRGSRRLADPQSATRFLLLAFFVPAVCALGEPGLFLTRWLAVVLGVVLIAPPALVLLPAWLAPPDEQRPETRADDGLARRDDLATEVPTFGDWLETGGLTLAAGLFGLILALARPGAADDWPLWGGTLLLTVWASLRQGLRGGTLAASAAGLVPLFVLPAQAQPAILQASLIAQCAAALLVAASFTWVRQSEARYRQVVGQVPVVLYSARVTARTARAVLAEVTLVSAACQEMLGCPPGELLGDHARWLERVHPQDREVVVAALAQLTRQRQPVVCEYRLLPETEDVEKTPARGQRWVRDTLAPRYDAAGTLVGWEGVVTETTAQRVLADDLRRTTSMFHVLVTNLPAGVFFIQGATGRPLLVNARARQLLGQREDASADLAHLATVYRLFRADGTPYPVEELPVYQALKHGRTSMRDDIVVHRPDGRRVPLVSWAAPLQLSASGELDAAVWVLEDLTAVRQAEAARRESDARVRAIVETIGEGLIVLDRGGKIVEANAAASLLFQTAPEHLGARCLDDLGYAFVGEDGAALAADRAPAAVVLRTGRPVRNVVLGLRLPDAAEASRWVLVNAMPLGQAGVVVTLTDVTNARAAQEIVRASEERYRGLVETLPLLVFQLDAALRVEYLNPAAQQVAGYDLDEVRDPALWTRLIHPEDLPRIHQALAQALAGATARYEFRYRTRDGGQKVGYALTQPRYLAGALVGVTSLILDLTRERQLERELEHAHRLELVGRLASGLVHDLNNLLTVVLNLNALAQTDLPGAHPLQEHLARINDAGTHAADLVGQLLDLSRQHPVALRVVDLNAVVRRGLELVRALLPGNVTLTSEVTTEALLVRADTTQLQQVLLNLCLNARDAMPTGGGLRVATRAHEGSAVLCVEDNGQGMSDEVRENLFRPHQTTKEHGHGLGLFVVRQIVENSGGRIEVWSERDRGARFEVRLPLASS